MTNRSQRALIGLLALAALARPASAWEQKGHTLINRLAAVNMPADTPAFFKDAADRLAYLGPEPDRWKVNSGDQLYAVNGPDHFMDMEPVLDQTFPKDRYRFISMLETSGILEKHHLTPDKLGFLPYRIAEVTQTLQSEWRDWKKAKTSSDAAVKATTPQIELDIIYTAGVLGHYVGDGSNPMHTTVHFNGWDTAYAPNPKGYTTAEAERPLRSKGFHGRVEGDFVDVVIDEKDVDSLVAPLKPVGPILDSAVAYLKVSNGQVARMYDLEKEGAFSVAAPGADGKRFIQERLAAGASELRDIWAMAMHGVSPRQPAAKAEGKADGGN
ncbi:MAG TPA: nuclease [Armatimonadota bacterium]